MLARQYPKFLNIIVTDSPGIHAGMPPGSCNPALIHIFATIDVLIDVAENGWVLKDYRKARWKYAEVRKQPLYLENVLAEDGHLLLFHP